MRSDRCSRRPQFLCGSGLPGVRAASPRIAYVGTACCVTLAIRGSDGGRGGGRRAVQTSFTWHFFKDTRRGRGKRRVCSWRSIHMAWPRRARSPCPRRRAWSLTRPRLRRPRCPPTMSPQVLGLGWWRGPAGIGGPRLAHHPSTPGERSWGDPRGSRAAASALTSATTG